MTHEHDHPRAHGGGANGHDGSSGAPGKTTRTSRLAVQRKPAATAAPAGAVATVVQRKETTTGVPLTETLEQAGGQIGAQLGEVMTTPYPERRNYPGPPKDAAEVENRLRGYGAQQGPTPEEKEWLYQAATALGLFKLGDAYKAREGTDKPINPARASVVAFALSQVGLVEAHTGAPDPENPGKLARKGYRHLQQYYVGTGRKLDEGVMRDHTIKVGPEGGNKIGSWCQIFSEWAVGKGGGTFQVAVAGKNHVKVPQPGDVAYMKQSEHMAVVIAVEGDQVTTVDGNMPSASAIMVCKRSLKAWDQGFHDTFPGT
jgi:hypothetical protein